jgi:hypothetical protein
MLGEAGQLGQPQNALGRQVADVDGADERQQMVLADRPQRDAPGQDELVVPSSLGKVVRSNGRALNSSA